MVTPPYDKGDIEHIVSCKLKDEDSLRVVEERNDGLLVDSVGDVALSFDDIIDQETYTLSRGFFAGITNSRSKRAVESAKVVVECAKSVQKYLREIGVEDAHIHFNFELQDDPLPGQSWKVTHKYDAIIHSNKEGFPHSTAYVLGVPSYTWSDGLEELLTKVGKLRESVKSSQPKSSHFHHCTNFVPVLGGQDWNKEMTAFCRAHSPPIWRAKPSATGGASYLLRRTFSTTSAIKVASILFR